jgi:hypothetical protein
MTEANGLQEVFDRFLDDFSQHHPLSPDQERACRHIEQCRTEALGGLQQQCEHCGYEAPQFYSCRDRHCPKCQGRAQQAWCEQQQQALLPVTYYHLVFTLPHELNEWVELHPEVIYPLLFQSVWNTLDAFGRDPKRLNGTLGMTCVLHTWGQTLGRHVPALPHPRRRSDRSGRLASCQKQLPVPGQSLVKTLPGPHGERPAASRQPQ